MPSDISNLWCPRGALVAIFKGQIQPAASTLLNYKSWTRPKNHTMVEIYCLGAGAGGGGGLTGAAASSRGGGGGGGSGAIARIMIPAICLPQTLFIKPGDGGAGGAASAIGIVGGLSAVLDSPSATLGTAANTIVQSGAAAAAGGVAGQAGGSAAGGVAGTIATNLLSVYTSLGLWTAIAGQAGGAAGALGAAGVAVAYGASGITVTGGGGGGSTNTSNTNGAGGAVTGAGLIPTIVGGLAAGGQGNPGYNLNIPFVGTGGSGGGANGAAGVGGFGGNAAWGG